MKLFFWLSLVSLVGCATHIAPYRAKKRNFKAGSYAKRPVASAGSLYALGSAGFFEEILATRVGDTLVIRIDEAESATRDATSKLSKKNSDEFGIPGAMGLMAALATAVPSIDPAKLLSSTTDSAFSGSGKVVRKGRLSATLPVRVKQVLPNGDLYVEGTKIVMVGNEEHHLYVSGIVRPADILADNSVMSSRVADAEMEYSGRGDVSDQQRPGWLSRFLRNVWPM